MLPSFSYVRPTGLAEAVRALATPGARVHAGGTDLLGCLRDGVFEAGTLVAIGGLAELRGIERRPDGSLRLGALTTLSEIAADPLVASRYRALAEGARSAASPQFRNQGTLGGNVCQRPRCWYFRGDFQCARKGGATCFAVEGENEYHAILGGNGCFIVHPSDTAPALVALEARARIAGPEGERVVPLESFFVGPEEDFTRETVLASGEILAEVVLPEPPAGTRSAYVKMRSRGAWDFALAGAAVALRMQGDVVADARVVLSGVAPIPWRAGKAERVLVGRRIEPSVVDQAAEAAVAGAEPLESNGYKVALAKSAVARALEAA